MNTPINIRARRLSEDLETLVLLVEIILAARLCFLLFGFDEPVFQGYYRFTEFLTVAFKGIIPSAHVASTIFDAPTAIALIAWPLLGGLVSLLFDLVRTARLKPEIAPS